MSHFALRISIQSLMSHTPEPPAEPISAEVVAAAISPAVWERRLRRLGELHVALGSLTLVLVPLLYPCIPAGWEALHWTTLEPLSERTEWIICQLRELPSFSGPQFDTQLLGLILFTSAVALELGLLLHGLLTLLIGLWLWGSRSRRKRELLQILSVMNLTYFPLGTLLSGWTVKVLWKPEVKALFDTNAPAPPGDRRNNGESGTSVAG